MPDPEDNAVRVTKFADKMRHGAGGVVHSCGVRHPRALKRTHARFVRENGKSVLLDELYPPQKSRDNLSDAA